MVTHQWPAKSVTAVLLCWWERRNKEIFKNEDCVCVCVFDYSRTLSFCKPCLTRFPFLSHTHMHQHHNRELSHSTKATKAHLDKVSPCSPTHHTHHWNYWSIIHSLMKTRKKKKSNRVIVFLVGFFVLSAEISEQLYIVPYCCPCLISFLLTYNIMLGQQKALIVCVVMAKGNRANMQDIYHPRLLCVCWFMCGSTCVEAQKTFSVYVCVDVSHSVYWSNHRSEHSQIHRENT